MNLRMYFFVPYNISEIQKGIQAGHCALEYLIKYGHKALCMNFVLNHKTWIILNGGTTRDDAGMMVECGDLNQIENILKDDEIEYASFREPDLNYALTAVCFIADERAWDLENYPDFDSDIPEKSWVVKSGAISALQVEPKEVYNQWIEFIGGYKNRILRDLIRGKRLA